MGNTSFTPFKDDHAEHDAGRMGMWLFLGSLGMVFGATIFAYIVVRLQLVSEADWFPEDAPGLPWLLYVSTCMLLFVSGALVMANRLATQGGSPRAVGGWMIAAGVLILAFLGMQAVAWIDLVSNNLLFGQSLYAWMFYVLTGLHALHVLAGLPPAFVTTANAFKGRYTGLGANRAGLVYCGMYWHFLDGVWIALFLVLIWGMRPG